MEVKLAQLRDRQAELQKRRAGLEAEIAKLALALEFLRLVLPPRPPAHQMGVMTLSTHIEIAGPVEAVWNVLTDFAAYPEWNPFVRRIDGKPAVGERLRVRVEPPGGRAMIFKPTVLAAVPNAELRLARTAPHSRPLRWRALLPAARHRRASHQYAA